MCAPVMGCAQYRYDVKQKTKGFFFSPSDSQKGNDSLVFGYLERGTTVQINMHGPICQYVISAGN